MCGIAGTVNLDGSPADRKHLEKIGEILAHRGPDGKGIHVDGATGFVHRRLKIIDLSEAASQPMHSPTEGLTLIYNGEIYNFRELRTDLEKAGCHFETASDTEVVLKAYNHWGEKAFGRFNGMFALAILDKKSKRITVARDRYGIKPLYYSLNSKQFVFASEIKAIISADSVGSELSPEGLLEYLTFQNFFTSNTLFKNINMFPAGCFGVFDLESKDNLKISRYWDFCFEEPKYQHDEKELIEELDRLFKQAVERQLVSDVEIGSYLSGGIDSGSITAIAAKSLPNLKTFTCGFDLSSASGVEMGFDERREAEFMSYKFQTEHYEMVLKAGDMERVLPKFTWHLEEPRVGQSYPNYYAAKLASKFVKVVLSGAGGDELFGGYPWRYYRAVVNDNFDHYVEKYYNYWQRLIPGDRIKDVLSPISKEIRDISTKEIFRSVFINHSENLNRPEDYVNHSLYFEAKTFLHGLLVVEDKLSMAHSLETRVPFLDNDLVDFSMNLPTHLKLGKLSEVVSLNENEPGNKTAQYFKKTRDGKLVLRKMLSRHVPEEVISREKQGFSAPDASWFKGESITYVKNLLLNPGSQIYKFLDLKNTASLINDHLEGRENRRLLIWSLLNLENWCQIYGSDTKSQRPMNQSKK